MDKDDEVSKDYKYFGVFRKDSKVGKNLEATEDALLVFGRAALILLIVYLPMIITSCHNDRDLVEDVNSHVED